MAQGPLASPSPGAMEPDQVLRGGAELTSFAINQQVDLTTVSLREAGVLTPCWSPDGWQAAPRWKGLRNGVFLN